MTADDLYGAALALMAESRDRAKGYRDKLVPLVNLLLAGAYPAEQALRRARGHPPLAALPRITTEGEELPYREELLAGALPYGLAGMLVMDDDPGKANYFNAVYDAALAALSPADFVPVADCYGGDGR
ncbi:hypothetical protein [Bittarella massiliensis (ex Durand et al. 2017)]|uniref:hypothetical protein n=1 Tax=Bittarella massiliensis (ex Durand et al. 2017) TaxID=1720313 RepID=UPI00073E43EB|nr:hypothetical protein [Bittarella massiliensis (ex Durand et al. 2017)]